MTFLMKLLTAICGAFVPVIGWVVSIVMILWMIVDIIDRVRFW